MRYGGKKNETIVSSDTAVTYRHVPVMSAEVLQYLDCRPGKTIVDCTLGGCGHAIEILQRVLPNGRLIGIDQDLDALGHAEQVLAPWRANVQLRHGNFSRITDLLEDIGIGAVDGILADLGISLYHIEGSGRGFSFSRDEPLDMRMNIETDVTADMLVNSLSEDELRRIFREYGEERWSGRIARAIVETRKITPIRSSRSLAEIVCRAVPASKKRSNGKSGRRRIHPATRVFMALRIAVNRELDSVSEFMAQAPALLRPGGRLCVLSFHSLEDRIVKHWMKAFDRECSCPPEIPVCTCGGEKVMRVLTRKACRPKAQEIERNPMARSTILRAAEKR
ncbi:MULTISPECIES: 16S rRNA (cytosine(1402)-N(4))-methyltransferase RsmH [Desulfococcus]|jgi:16S rRNA (cytosine1402-N4)-methyltransferase|uniref:Ribosomal RNA small subunit methyltransferase H n=1 Tax=Desulfococcus multivorans DSM 2059 TaxID=1121405 RepID=S7TAP7_DESML|nr:16S rRNA (cytosine(1402)-N(4))-methyltransferase RsmH [Desulfococcus multivorans]AQV03054.2 16S rRNA (cytosine(1402)-N(4))-methyltransferase [Desulfococcus multivorans]EPR34202.1 Ribosomal RNA small subunit methyltransferase H [Desulfococcus multivorans DSM 2059]MDX9819045.1 16S rRNA (cytosine(1402)-N(4))-methyltransferase RsmH [Desulfococcus multivorans]SKA20083.1 16S rRNA (cytosine1402-N4)-methyltransferase [Desulfococcus multivorans DSM 2059]